MHSIAASVSQLSYLSRITRSVCCSFQRQRASCVQCHYSLLPAHSCDSTAEASVHSMPPPASARLKLFSTLFSTTAL